MSFFDLEKAKRLISKASEHLRGQRELSDESAQAAAISIKQQMEYREAAIERSRLAAKHRIQTDGPAKKAIFAICEDLCSHNMQVTWRAVNVILKDDADRPIEDDEGLNDDSGPEDDDLFAIHTLWSARRQEPLPPNGSLVSKLFDAKKLDIRIQEVRESTEEEGKTRIYYITRDGVEGSFTVKTMKNIVGKFLRLTRP